MSELLKRQKYSWLPQTIYETGSCVGAGSLALKCAISDSLSASAEQTHQGPVAEAALMKFAIHLPSQQFKDFADLIHNSVPVQCNGESESIVMQTAFSPSTLTYDLVIACNTLETYITDVEREKLVQSLWAKTNPEGGILVLIERGQNECFELIAAARHKLLRMADGNCRIIAPCPHHDACPYAPAAPSRYESRSDWCHFSQRLQATEYVPSSYSKTVTQKQYTQHYSYLVMQRGVERPSLHLDVGTRAYRWPRIVATPDKLKGHVHVRTCAPSGKLENAVFTKAMGKELYRGAIKLKWGDLLSLESEKIPLEQAPRIGPVTPKRATQRKRQLNKQDDDQDSEDDDADSVNESSGYFQIL